MYWGLIDGDAQQVLVTVMGQHDTVTLFNVKHCGDEHVVYVCVCVGEELGKVLLRSSEGTRILGRTRRS